MQPRRRRVTRLFPIYRFQEERSIQVHALKIITFWIRLPVDDSLNTVILTC